MSGRNRKRRRDVVYLLSVGQRIYGAADAADHRGKLPEIKTFENCENNAILEKANTGRKGDTDMAGTPEYELLNRNFAMVDGHAVKAPEDYQDPEQLYQALIERVRK